METWTTTAELTKIRDFKRKANDMYHLGQSVVRGNQINSLTIRPGKDDKLLPLQELSPNLETMEELIKAAKSMGIVVWRGNLSQTELLR